MKISTTNILCKIEIIKHCTIWHSIFLKKNKGIGSRKLRIQQFLIKFHLLIIFFKHILPKDRVQIIWYDMNNNNFILHERKRQKNWILYYLYDIFHCAMHRHWLYVWWRWRLTNTNYYGYQSGPILWLPLDEYFCKFVFTMPTQLPSSSVMVYDDQLN